MMKKGPLGQRTFEAIEAYLIGTMSDAEREQFEAELAHDPVLRTELELQRENMLAVELGQMRQTLGRIMDDAQADAATAPPRWGTWLRHAAIIALPITLAIWWMWRPAPHERLFAAHFTADPGLPVTMSTPPGSNALIHDPLFNDAMVAYKLGHMAEARTKWASLLPARPHNDTLRFFIANAALVEGRTTEALPLLRTVAADNASTFRAKARWFLFLALLHAGDRAALDSLHLEDDPVYGERVRAIRAALK